MAVKYDGTPKSFMGLAEEDRMTIVRGVCFGSQNIEVDDRSCDRISKELMDLGKHLAAWKSADAGSYQYQTAELEVHSKVLQCSRFCKNKKPELHGLLEAFRVPFKSKYFAQDNK